MSGPDGAISAMSEAGDKAVYASQLQSLLSIDHNLHRERVSSFDAVTERRLGAMAAATQDVYRQGGLERAETQQVVHFQTQMMRAATADELARLKIDVAKEDARGSMWESVLKSVPKIIDRVDSWF